MNLKMTFFVWFALTAKARIVIKLFSAMGAMRRCIKLVMVSKTFQMENIFAIAAGLVELMCFLINLFEQCYLVRFVTQLLKTKVF
jgi:hypothetical protein